MPIGLTLLLCYFVSTAYTALPDLPVKLEIKAALDSRSANVHLSQAHHTLYPFTVTYGSCHSLSNQHEQHHTVSEVFDQGTDRLVWILPDDISTVGCLFAWSSRNELVGRSEPLEVNKFGKQWLKKRHLDLGTRLSRRASIPMTNASGIDAEGPWFDGVVALKEKGISALNAAEAKAKSMYPPEGTGVISTLMLACRDCHCGCRHGWFDDLGQSGSAVRA